MALIRATFFFKDTLGSGWSETIHNNGADLNTVRGDAIRLVPLRVQTLGTTVSLEKVRVSDDLVFRDSANYNVPIANQMNKTAGVSGAAFSDLCIITNLRATAISRRTLFLRGFPDDIEMNSGNFVPTPAWLAAFNDYSLELVAGHWCIKSKDRLIVPDQITAAVQALPSGIVTVTTLNPHGFVPGQGVVITGVRGAVQLNGTFPLLATPAANTFTVQLLTIMSAYTGAGFATRLGFTLQPITSTFAERIGERKAGAPFDLRHGRRRARART